jgi:N6-L-threonylcarbamoyladenine synthase
LAGTFTSQNLNITDNAAMIAMVAKLKFERGEFTDLKTSATAKYDM